jgi:protein ImuB
MLWLALHFPRLPLEVLARDSEDRSQVVAEGNKVLTGNECARATGITRGLALSAAWALAADLRVHARNEREERAALDTCAGMLLGYSPAVTVVPPATLLVEIEGSAHLYSGVAALRAHAVRTLDAAGYRVRAALAPTPLAATWLAQNGLATDVRDPARLRAALEPLPLAVLGLDPVAAVTLEGIGIRTLGDCLALPRPEFARRFGTAPLTALDRALGRTPDPRLPFLPPATFRSRLELPAPVREAAALLFAGKRLLGELAAFLAGTGRGVTRCVFELTHEDRRMTPVEVRLTGATRDPQRLERVTRERFERLVITQPVEALALAATQLRPLAGANCTLFPAPAEAEEDAAQLIERLRARLGEDAVQGLVLVADHRPERACRYAPRGRAGPGSPRTRPLWLLNQPQPLRLRNARPCLGEPLTLLPARERIESGWWDGDASRDYFVARDTAGAHYWLYRAGARGGWFLHGVFG